MVSVVFLIYIMIFRRFWGRHPHIGILRGCRQSAGSFYSSPIVKLIALCWFLSPTSSGRSCSLVPPVWALLLLCSAHRLPGRSQALWLLDCLGRSISWLKREPSWASVSNSASQQYVLHHWRNSPGFIICQRFRFEDRQQWYKHSYQIWIWHCY